MMRELDTGTATVAAAVTNGVGIIELNRPNRRNALHPEMFEAIPRLIEIYDAAEDVGCILITARGTTFCAGGDVRDGADRDHDELSEGAASEALTQSARMTWMLQESPKISLAALPGAAVGAGIAIALAADLRIAAQSTRLIGGWSALAFSGDFGGPWLLTQTLGPSRTLEFLIGSESIDAEAGLRLGLFNRVVPDDQTAFAAQEWAEQIAAGPRAAYTLMKQNVRDAQRLPLREALVSESTRMVRSGRTDEHRDAVKRWLHAAQSKRAKR